MLVVLQGMNTRLAKARATRRTVAIHTVGVPEKDRESSFLLSRWAFVLMPSAARWNIGSKDQGCIDPTQTMLPYFVFTRETHGELRLRQSPAALALGSTGLLAFGQPSGYCDIV